MSAAMAMREVGAPRTFSTVCGAILFYARDRERRLSVSIPLERGSDPMNREEVEEKEFTVARIIACLTPRAKEDWDSRYVLDPRDVELLIEFYDSTASESNDNLQALARRAGMTVAEFLRHVRETRNVLRRRMKEREIIE